MPYIPKKVKSNLNGADILNAARNEIGGSYAAQVPQALKEGDVSRAASLQSLREIGSVLQNNDSFMNAFLSSLINRIGLVLISSRLYENPWAKFKKGVLEYGESVEEIFVALAQGYQFSMENGEKTLHKVYNPDVHATIHSINFQKYYPTTVNPDLLRQAFLSWDGLNNLITSIIEQVYTGANYDELMVMKYMLAKHMLNGDIYAVNIPDATSANAKEITTEMLTVARNLSLVPSSLYNIANVPNYTDKRFLQFILTSEVSSLLDVNVLALSFNMEKAELIGNQTYIDDFGTFDNSRLQILFEDDPYTQFIPFTSDELSQLSTVKGLMCDINFFMIFDNLLKMTEFYNPKGLYMTYFLHKWTTFRVSPYANAIMFTTLTPSISSISITPASSTVKKGNSVQLTASVVSNTFASKKGIWEISGSGLSTVSDTGLVTVSQAETETSLTVKFTSLFDSSKSASATITVSA